MTSRARAAPEEENVSLRNRLSGPSDQKAGLKRDPEVVKQIIYEASKGSKYFLNEKRKDEELTIKVNKLVAHVDQLVEQRGGDLRQEEQYVDEMIVELEKQRDLSQVVVVVDADAFYASCHELVDPTLKGTAFAVGSGVLTTASYAAREYGCRSAQAGHIARKLCPHLKFVKLDFSLYTDMSRKIMTILRQYGPMSKASLDEAYISLTEYCAKNNLSPEQAAQRMRDQVKKETGLTVSAGVSANATLSKIAADLRKPDGQYIVPSSRSGVMSFMNDLPIRKVPGIGRVSERWLTALNVNTVGDVYKMRGKLFLVRKQIGLTFLLRAYLGLGRTTIKSAKRGGRKAVGCEKTFSPVDKVDELYKKLRNIADTLEGDLKRSQYSGRTITLKLKHDTYEVASRAMTFGKAAYVSDADTLYRAGKKLLDREIENFAQHQKKTARGKPVTKPGQSKLPLRLRLLGLRMSNLRDERDGNLNKWASGKGAKTRSSAGQTNKLETLVISDDEEERDALSDWNENELDECLSPGSNGASPHPFEDEDAEELEQTIPSPPRPQQGVQKEKTVSSPQIPLSSSEALWAAVGGVIDDDLEFDFDSVNESAELATHLRQADETDIDDRFKPFWTAGESQNSRQELAYLPVANENKLHFDTSSSASSSRPANTLTCPVCEKSFVATETAMAHHVESHFPNASEHVSKQKRAKSDTGPARLGSIGSSAAREHKRASEGVDKSAKKQKLENFWRSKTT